MSKKGRMMNVLRSKANHREIKQREQKENWFYHPGTGSLNTTEQQRKKVNNGVCVRLPDGKQIRLSNDLYIYRPTPITVQNLINGYIQSLEERSKGNL